MRKYQIEAILDGPDDQDRFLIKWEGYSDDQNTWESRANLPDGMLDEYLGVVEETKEEESDASSSSTVQNLSRRRRAGKRVRREPGVNVAKVVDPSSAQGREPANPPRLAKGTGNFAVVNVCGRFLHPIAPPIRAQDPNNWRVKVYQMVVTGWGREVIKKERAYVLLLEPGSRHDGEELCEQFWCRFVHAKLADSCPPNQLFKPSDFTCIPPTVDEGSDLSSSSDDESIEDEGCDVYNAEEVIWETDAEGELKFRPTMSACYRQIAEPASSKHPSSLPHQPDPSVYEAEWFLDLSFPQTWWKNEVVPAWNAKLASLSFRPTSVGEANVWRGLWRWMSFNPQYARKDFWDITRKRIAYQWDPQPFREHMSRDRFKQLTQCFTLQSDRPPHYCDEFFEVRRMQEAFTEHMKLNFSPA
jgi:hypothetical protein